MRRMTFVAMFALAGAACSDDVSGPGGNNGGPNVPSVGDPLTLNVPRDVENPCDAEPDPRDGRVVAVTPTTIVVVDEENPLNGLTDDQYAGLGDDFDVWGYSVVTEYFGEPSDLDENDRVIAFFTHAVNEFTEDGEDGVVFGLFWPGDLFPTPTPNDDGCATSNFAEVLYLAVPESNGPITANLIQTSAVATMGHEMQHLVNASVRLFSTNADDFEEIWLNEGLSHVTEELMFFERAGGDPGDNIDVEWLGDPDRQEAFFQFQFQNFSRFAIFLEDPETDTASLLNTEGTLASRGSDWHFLRYAADRRGSEADFWRDLVNTDLSGLPNLTQVLGTDPEPWIRDWSAAVYADDEASTDPDFQFPSWNLRDIYPAIQDTAGDPVYPEYPLAFNELTDADPLDLDVAGMAAAYVRVDVPATGTATVTLRSGAGAPPAQLRLSVVNAVTGDVVQHEGGDAAEVTLDGGASGTMYVLAALNASTTAGTMLPLKFESQGAGAAAIANVASRAHTLASRGSLARALSAAAVPRPAVNHRFHIKFLERAQRQLMPRIPHARRVYHERERLRELTY